MKSSHHFDTTRHAIMHSALLPVLQPVESPERVGRHGPSVVVIGLPEPEPAVIDTGLYTDLQTAMTVAEQMRQLIAVYRSLYGELYLQPHH
ncbi:MAG: hypothetical protein MZV65_26850 [Chromatiales bacterium]|nr:hypothetical protein [Chromatiales bacterium]